MTLDLSALDGAPRLLIDAELAPVQGQRFQPTGFPDLGPARFRAQQPDGGSQDCLLVESAQSMANRLEATLWDESKHSPIVQAEGISYIQVNRKDDSFLTSSILEAHRLNSVYIEKAEGTFHKDLGKEIGYSDKDPIDRHKFAQAVLKYDVNSLLHGTFLESIGGRLRLTRALSSFIEAQNVNEVASGGVKNDHVMPGKEEGKQAKDGFGNVPFQREEFTAGSITAYFNLDLQLIRSYGLGEAVERLLIVLALYKVRALLDGHLRLRTACDLDVVDGGIHVRRPAGFDLPDLPTLASALSEAIAAVRDQMTVTTVTYTK